MEPSPEARTTIATIFLDSEMSGTPRRIVRIAKYLNRSRFRSIVILPKAQEGLGEFAQELRRIGITVYEVPNLNRPRYSLNPRHLFRWLWHLGANVKAVRDIFKREAPQILHVYGTTQVTGPIGAIGRGMRVVWHINDDALPVWMARVVFPVFRLLCDRFAASSIALAERYFGRERKRWPDGLAVLYSTVDLPQFVPSAPREETRGSFRATVDDVLVGMVGNLAPSKGHLTFLEATGVVKTLAKRTPRFVIVGRELELWRGYRDQVHGLVEELGLRENVQFAGYRADIPDVLNAFDVLVVPSVWEPLGVIVMEGMAAGKAIVATDAGGIPEMVRDGVEALLFPAKDGKRLADAIIRLLDESRLAIELGQNARERVRKVFSPERAAAAYERLYSAMLSLGDHRGPERPASPTSGTTAQSQINETPSA